MNLDTRAYSVSDFADDFLGGEPGHDLADAGSAAREIAVATGSETLASPLIATVLWQAFIKAGGLKELESPVPLSGAEEVFVVRHPLRGGPPRHDLLVLVPDWAEEEHGPRGLGVEFTSDLIECGWNQVRDRFAEQATEGSAIHLLAMSPAALMEAAEAQDFGVVVAPAPEMLDSSAPSPALEARCPEHAPEYSTAGVLVRSADGRVGVTVALHTLPADARAKGTEVWIDSRQGTVRSVDAITDSAFVELDSIEGIGTDGRVRAVLSGFVPRNYEEVTYEGRASGETRTFVTGWTPELPLVSPDTQSRITTEPDTVPGDSGAAVIDSHGNVLGFAFRRTGYNERPPHASWIWAESVLLAHGLGIVLPEEPT